MNVEQAERTHWPAIVVMMAAGAVVAMQIGKVPATLPDLRADFGMSLRAAAWVVSIFSVIAVVAGATLGLAGERYGYVRVSVGALLAMAAANFWGATATTTASLLGSRFFEGLAFVLVTVSVPPMFIQYSAARHWRPIFGVWGTYWPIGFSLMLLATPVALATVGWRGLWVANGVIGLIVASMLWWTTRGRREGPARATSWREMARQVGRTMVSTGPLVLALIFATYSAIMVTTVSFLPTLYLENGDITAPRVAVLTALVVAMNIVGNLLAGVLLQKGARRGPLIVVAFVVMTGLTIIIFGNTSPFDVRYGAAILFSLVGGLIPTACLSGSAIHAPAANLVGATNGVIMQGAGAGQIVGPVATTIVVTAFIGWPAAPWVFAVNAAAGIALAVVLGMREKRLGLV